MINLYFNRAIAGNVTISAADNSYLLDFDEIVYNLAFDFDGPTTLDLFKVKINDGDSIKLYDINPTKYSNVEIYKIEFIKQHTVSDDVVVNYQGFVRR